MDWTKMKRLKGFTTNIVDTAAITDCHFVKSVRNRLNVSQRLLAKILGVDVSTVEKWESGKKPVKGTASRLFYLLDKHQDLIDDLYQIEGILSKDDQMKHNKAHFVSTLDIPLNVQIEREKIDWYSRNRTFSA